MGSKGGKKYLGFFCGVGGGEHIGSVKVTL